MSAYIEDRCSVIEEGIYADPYVGRGSERMADALVALACLRVSVIDRAQLTRALTAQAWAVACACVMSAKPKPSYLSAILARLPTPAELAAEILGDT